MEQKVNVNANEFIETENKERIFARICQILDKNNRIIKIPFDRYDELEYEILSKDNYFDNMPEFFSEDTKQRILLMRIIEKFCNEEETTMEDLLGAIINPALCVGKSISTHEDVQSLELIVELSEQANS